MARIKKSDLVVFDALSIVTITGYEPDKSDRVPVDPAGSANWLVDAYGMAPDDGDASDPGILWADYDGPDWTFRVLITSGEVENLKTSCEDAGYSVDAITEVDRPMTFGDGSGIVEILKHRDGWVLAS